MNRFVAGALGGLVATIPMTMVMKQLWKGLPKNEQYHLPPREITEVSAEKVSLPTRHLSENQMAALSLVAHFSYGAITGALYPVVCREPRRPLLIGAGYGIGTWGVSYLGWIPAAHILKPATQHPASRNQMMLISHLVWGAITVLIGERLRKTGIIRQNVS